jgi:hypothetical protein
MVDGMIQTDPVDLFRIIKHEPNVKCIQRSLLLCEGKEAAATKVLEEDYVPLDRLCRWFEDREEKAKQNRWRTKTLRVFTNTGFSHPALF